LGRLAIVLACASGTPGFAQDEAEASEPTAESTETRDDVDDPGLISRMERLADDSQREASKRFTGFISSVDGFFGDGTGSEEGNESWARLRLEASRPGGRELGFGATVKVRVVLPQAEQRFRLLLSSEEEDESVVTEEGAIRPPQLDDPDGQDLSLALRFLRTARRRSRLGFDLGVRQREGLVQLFGRVNAVAEGELAHLWTARASNSYFYYAKSGYENRLRFDINRPLSDSAHLVFRTSTGFNWRRGRKGAVVNQTLGLYADLDERMFIALEALAGYATALGPGSDKSPRYSGAEVRVRFRHSVWRRWFYYELWPSVAWPSSTDYELAYGGRLRVEILFGRTS